jgi:hypothetical protein
MQAVSLSIPGKVHASFVSAPIMIMFLFSMVYAPLAQAGATVITLTLSSSFGRPRERAVNVTAAVSNGSAVTLGRVAFCDAVATFCWDPDAVIESAINASIDRQVVLAFFRLVPNI